MAGSKKNLNEIVVTRILDAPCELVWKAWTEPEHFKQWWGPKESTAPFCEIDLRVGGRNLFCMKFKDGTEIWSTGTYKEVIPCKRLVSSHSFADEKGNIVPATYYGFEGEFELEMEITVTFHDLGDGKTKIILRQAGMPDSHIIPTNTGWNSSFDKLAESLK